MKEYKTERLRNVGIVSHGGAGKTSLTEAILYTSGAVTRLGKVDDGTATTDFDPEEIKRKVSINAAIAPCEWREHKINFIDTPGYADFVAEVKGALRAVDSALVVLCAASGVEVETEKVWAYAEELGLPKIAFINKMDRENADFFAVLEKMREVFGPNIVPIQIPIGAQDTFKGIVDLIRMKAILPADASGTKITESDIPAELMEKAKQYRQQMVEAAAEGDDDLLTKYLEGEELTEEEIRTGLAKSVAAARFTPVLCGSAIKNIGVAQLLDSIIAYVPSPVFRTVKGAHPATKAEEVRACGVDQPLSALVFKTTADPFVGKINFFRVFSGVLKPDSMLYNASKDKTERIGQVFTMRGKTQDSLTQVVAGDIAAVAKLQETGTGDTLCDKDKPILLPPIDFPVPMFAMAVEAKSKGDEDKIGNGLARLTEEDPTFKVKKDTETGQMLIMGMGELHLDIITERLRRKFGVDTRLSLPKVPYRETIRTSVKVEGKHKKQTGGHGQYGHVWLQLDPLPPASGFEFAEQIFGGAVPRQYIPAVEKGAREILQEGVLAGYPLVDLKVTLYDGSYHTVDSSEMAFKLATHLAMRKGVQQAKPVLLEPVMNVEVTVPEYYMGDIVGDFNSKRGKILGMEPVGKGLGVVRAQVPLAEMFRYTIDLKSMTQGRGTYAMDFSHYEEVPQRIAETIIANAKKEKAEEEK